MKTTVKRILLYAVAPACILAISGCNSFLDTTPTSEMSDKLVWTKKEYVDLYVNNFYAYVARYGQFGSDQFSGNLTEGLTNTFKYGSTAPGTLAGDANNYVFYPERITPAQNLLDEWADSYLRIRRINEFLVSMERNSTFSDSENLLYEAQARFFRAYCYFQLAKRHGGVILYTDMDLVKDKNRSTEEETWQLIADDLDFAAANLPVKWDAANSGRVTRYAAWALKSRAMLYAKRWQDAVNAADSVILNGGYALAPTYEEGYAGGNSESIFEYDYDPTGLQVYHNFDRNYVPYGDYALCGADENSSGATPTQEMVEYYEDKNGNPVDWTPWHTTTTTPPPYDQLEPRFHATILYCGSTWKGNKIIPTPDGVHGRFLQYGTQTYAKGQTTTGYYLRKLLNEDIVDDLLTRNSNQPWVELRLAEVYLNRAEARYMLGDNAGALEDINVIRHRAELPDKTGLSGDALFEAIRHERLIELAYEGHLYWDMRRWRLSHVEYNNYRCHGIKITGSESAGYTYEYVDCDGQDRKFLEKLYVFPVPDSETLNNSAIEQYDEWK